MLRYVIGRILTPSPMGTLRGLTMYYVHRPITTLRLLHVHMRILTPCRAPGPATVMLLYARARIRQSLQHQDAAP
eukprot:8110556-Alexandrium_andersonii.AAC.1